MQLWDRWYLFVAALWRRPDILLGRLLMIVLVIAVALILFAVTRRALQRVSRRLAARGASGDETLRVRVARSVTVVSLLGSIIKWAILLLALLSVLAIVGVNLLPVLAGAGIAGVAIGLGAQSLIRDFLSGLFIMLEGQFAVGDYVNIGGTVGVVEELGLRVTVLRDLQGQLHYIPNGGISTVVVYSHPRVTWGVELPVQAEHAPQAAQELLTVLEDLRQEFPRHILGWQEPIQQALKTGQVALQATVDAFPGQQWVVQEELPARWMRGLKLAQPDLPDDPRPRVYEVISGPRAAI